MAVAYLPRQEEGEIRRLLRRLGDLEDEVRRLRGDGGGVKIDGDLIVGSRVRGLHNPIHDFDATPRKWVRDEIDSRSATVVAANAVTSIGESGDTVSGDVLLAEGANVTITRAGQTITIAAAASIVSSADFWVWDDFGAATGTGHTLSQTPSDVDKVDVYLSGVRLVRVAAGPANDEYTLSGTTLTLGLSKAATDSLVVVYPYSSPIQTFQWDDLTGAASSSFTLSQTPSDPTQVDVFLTGVRLYYVTPGPPSAAEFTLSGTAGTLGFTRAATDSLIARYTI